MVSKAQFEKIALSFEGVEKGASYGKPAFLLAKKFFTRLRGMLHRHWLHIAPKNLVKAPPVAPSKRRSVKKKKG